MLIPQSKFRQEFQTLLDRAADSRMPNMWTGFERLAVYLRVSRRLLEPLAPGADFRASLVRCVDIANVSTETKYQGKGMFTRLVATIHDMTPMPIYLENAHRDFAEHLLAHGDWKLINSYHNILYILVHYKPEVSDASPGQGQ